MFYQRKRVLFREHLWGNLTFQLQNVHNCHNKLKSKQNLYPIFYLGRNFLYCSVYPSVYLTVCRCARTICSSVCLLVYLCLLLCALICSYYWECVFVCVCETHVVLTVVLREPPCQHGSPFSYTIWLYWSFGVPAHIPHFLKQNENKKKKKKCVVILRKSLLKQTFCLFWVNQPFSNLNIWNIFSTGTYFF